MQDQAERELRQFRTEMTGLQYQGKISEEPNINSGQFVLSSSSLRKGLHGNLQSAKWNPPVAASKIKDSVKGGPGERDKELIATSGLQKLVGDALAEALLHCQDGLARAIAQQLQAELGQLVSLMPSQRSSDNSAKTSASVTAPRTSSPRSGSGLVPPRSQAEMMPPVPLRPPPTSPQQRRRHPVGRSTEPKLQALADSIKDLEVKDESGLAGSQQEGRAGGLLRRRRGLTVMTHKIVLTQPIQREVSVPSSPDGRPDSEEVNSAAAPTSASVRRGTVSPKKLREVERSPPACSTYNVLDGGDMGRTRGSLQLVNGGSSSPLPPPPMRRTMSLQACRVGGWSLPALGGVGAGGADIVLTSRLDNIAESRGDTQELGKDAPTASSFLQHNQPSASDKAIQARWDQEDRDGALEVAHLVAKLVGGRAGSMRARMIAAASQWPTRGDIDGGLLGQSMGGEVPMVSQRRNALQAL